MARFLSFTVAFVALVKLSSIRVAAEEPQYSALDTLLRIVQKEPGLKSADGLALQAVNLTADGRLIVAGSALSVDQASKLGTVIQKNKTLLSNAFEKKVDSIKVIDLSRVSLPPLGKKAEPKTEPKPKVEPKSEKTPVVNETPYQNWTDCCPIVLAEITYTAPRCRLLRRR